MSAGQPVESALSLEQLNQLKQQLEEEYQVLTSSFQQLKVAASRYHQLKEDLKVVHPDNQGKTALIPLTASLYVPGQLADVNKVIVDIGTGYYVKKTVKEADQFADRKIGIINENLDKVQQAIYVKRKNLESVLLVMQSKIDEIEKRQASK